MTRGVRTTLVLFMVLAGLVAFVVYSNSAKDETEDTPATTYLWELSSEDVAQLRVAPEGVVEGKDCPAGVSEQDFYSLPEQAFADDL